MKVTVFWNVMAVSLIASDHGCNLQGRQYYTPSHTSEEIQKLSITNHDSTLLCCKRRQHVPLKHWLTSHLTKRFHITSKKTKTLPLKLVSNTF